MPEHFLGLEGAYTIKTANYLLTQRAVDDLVRVKGMGIIHGAAGLGKSYAVRSAVERQTDVHVNWFDFPGRTTTKAVVQALLKEITGSAHEATRSRLEVLLLDLLIDQPRLIVIDEAQRLYAEAIEYLRHLYDRPNTHFALLLVGGYECWERVSSYPMVWSRMYKVVGFEPLTPDEVLEQIPVFHAIYKGVEPELIGLIDDEFAHGNLRNWTKFTVDVLALMCENDLRKLTPEVAQAIFAMSAGGAGVHA